MAITKLGGPGVTGWGQASGALGSFLTRLADQKMQEMEAAREAKAFTDIGLPKEYAAILRTLPAKQRMEGINQYFTGLEEARAAIPEEYDMLKSLQEKPQISPYAPGYQGERQPGYEATKQTEVEQMIPRKKREPTIAEVLIKGKKSPADTALAKQQIANATKWLEKEKPQYESAKRLEREVESALAILKSGRIKGTGFLKALQAGSNFKGELTKDEQELNRLLDSIVIEAASQGKGVPSKARLELQKGAKVSLANSIPAAIEGLKHIKEGSIIAQKPYDFATKIMKEGSLPHNSDLGSFVHQMLKGETGDFAETFEASEAPKDFKSYQVDELTPEVIAAMPEGAPAWDENGKKLGEKRNGKFVRV